MRHALDLAAKDLLQIVRDRKSAVLLLAMPLIITFFMGWIFGQTGGESDTRLAVGFVDRDGASALSAGFHDLIDSSGAIRPVALEGEEADNAADAVRDGDIAAAVIVPAHFRENALAGEQVELTVIVDQTTAAGQTAFYAIDEAFNRLQGSVEIARLSAEAFADEVGFDSDGGRQAYMDEALSLAAAAWADPPFGVRVETPATEGKDEGEEEADNPFLQASPGMIVQFVVYGVMTSGTILVLERKSKALQRMLTTPISRAAIIGGHFLSMFVVMLFQEIVLIVVGQLAFGVDYMRVPLATGLVAVGLALWTTALGLLISALAKTEEQVILYSLLAMFLFSALGGAWFPLEITGPVFSAIGHATPGAWAMDGFQNIVLRGLGLSSVLLPAGVLLGAAGLFFGLALWRFRFE